MLAKGKKKVVPKGCTIAQVEASKYITCFYLDELGFYRHLDPDRIHLVSSDLGPTNRLAQISNTHTPPDQQQNGDPQYEQYYKEIRQSLGISHFDRVVDYEIWKENWDNFMSSKLAKKEPTTLNHDFKMKVRSGIPHDYRSKVWCAIIRMRTRPLRCKFGENLYQVIIKSIERDQKAIMVSKLNDCFKQIDLDVLRTLPNNCHFENAGSKGTKRVRRILRAYAYFNPTVGYCQGMNRLAAIALLVLPEEEAFWCLVAIIQCIMPKDYYVKPWLAQVDCYVLSDLMKDKMPKLHRHLLEKETQLTIFTWFFTVFVDAFRPELMFRIWDCFLLEGDIVLFRFGLAILYLSQEDLLKLTDLSSINTYLSKLVSTRAIDVEQLFEIAFKIMEPLPKAHVELIRNKHKRKMLLNINEQR